MHIDCVPSSTVSGSKNFMGASYLVLGKVSFFLNSSLIMHQFVLRLTKLIKQIAWSGYRVMFRHIK